MASEVPSEHVGSGQSPTMASPATVAAAPPVIVYMNDPARNAAQQFPDNFIKTAKYNLLTFLPLNLFHQFSKVSNLYFLLNMIIAVAGPSPINPWTAVLPLIFVVGVALLKDGYEDYLRHVADNRANSIDAWVVRKNASGKHELTKVESRDVQVGDIMRIQNGDELRADVILLSSTGVESQAFIETCNLDGETNLKNRKGSEATWHLNSIETLVAANLELRTGEPSPALLHWTGMLVVDGREEAVGLDQFLYRSCILKNTEEAWGLVAYAGVDTKMFRNLQEKPPKKSNLDLKLNKLILAIFILQTILLIIIASLGTSWTTGKVSSWYLQNILDQTGAKLWGYRYLTYFILLSYLIPISLFVTIELCKVAQGLLMRVDQEMMEWMNEKWVSCTPNTTNLNEQLSQVKFIFSDKTGTLTENVMYYLKGDIRGNPVDRKNLKLSKDALKNPSTREECLTYWRAMALCHTINPFPDAHHPGKIKYDGSSPDEIALVETAVEHGVVLKERATRNLVIEVDGVPEKYEILATLEFTPDRKMMSIVLRTPEGKIIMFTKGADSFVAKRMHPTANAGVMPATQRCLDELGALGLRTLIVCKRDLTQEMFDAWYVKFIEAGKTLVKRSEAVDDVCRELEWEMLLVGLTAIEDKLQDQVPETLRYFLDAGVVVWMLTGDKRETAATIAATSALLHPINDYVEHIDIKDNKPDSDEAAVLVERQLLVVKSKCDLGDRRVTFICDGPALDTAMTKKRALFIEVSQRVNSAVCCRLTPLQKASVVNMFQQETGETALAIGDGANDVSMIQEGRVGVGIVGLEGAQAALAADYAIPRFKHLRRLCAVHGRYALYRNALCVSFSFYKNIMMSMTQFYLAFFTGFSGTTIMDGWLLTFFNIAFTSAPPLALGMFEKDLCETALLEQAHLFPHIAAGLYFDAKALGRWFSQAFIHSIIIFFLFFPTLKQGDLLGDKVMDGNMVGTILITSLIMTAIAKICISLRYWQGIQLGAMIFSIVLYIAFILIYSAVTSVFGDTSFYYTTFYLFAEPKWWLYIALFVVGLLFPVDIGVVYIQRQLFPTARDTMQLKYAD